ncbi:GNAT family N-acetyltransferase [Pedobacter flavus]|uniref:GNAT family protein n=1 Tax=Pedobacter flavus TaxID=3113906 RepID=A0ABU7H3Q8_9SPHI|nr:GNAT family protein [Pedobacter sp. VNH31]MEE1885900.1 GNAT family protein [Pedobacter sp. VNH31]
MTDFPSLQTQRLEMRQIQSTDLENIFKGLSNPLVIKHYGVSYSTLEATQEQMAWYQNLYNTNTGIWWAICAKLDGTFYGAAGFNDIHPQHKKAEIGFWLLPEYWNNGIMQEALTKICHYGFEHMKLHRIEGFVESENSNSKKALEKMDFLHEGTLRACEWKNGKWIDVDIYAKINQL